MERVMMKFIVVVLATFSMQSVHAADDLSKLDCDDLKFTSVELFPLPCDIIYNPMRLSELNCTKPYVSLTGLEWVIDAVFQVDPESYNDSTKGRTVTTTCLTLYVFAGSTAAGSNFFMQFDSLAYVGVLQKSCNTYSDENCLTEVLVSRDFISLPPFTYSPDEPSFWDFSSPLFAASDGWLDALSVRGRFGQHYPLEISGLAGSSITQLSLDGSFGSDVRGYLPHLDHLPLLEQLTLINSPREDLTQGDIFQTGHIKYLQLTENSFLEIPKSIAKLRHLEYLVFQSKLSNFTLVPASLKESNNLYTLNLSRTSIKHWPQTFPNLPKLVNLLLSCCNMKSFRVALPHFPRLRTLDLGNNLLSSLTNDAFKGLNNLEILNLSYNAISELPPKLIATHEYLKEVYMNSNNFTKWPKLPCNSFSVISVSQTFLTQQNLKNLARDILSVYYIDISQNRFSTWDDPTIFLKETNCTRGIPAISEYSSRHVNQSMLDSGVSKPWATKVNLSNNHIAFFSEAMLHSLDALTEVDLGGNMIDCGTCQTSLLQKWLYSTRTIVTNLGKNTLLTCYQPPEYKGQPVQQVNFQEVCSIPRRYLWLGIGAPTAGVIAFVVIGGVLFYFRAEVVYLAHLAKVRAAKKNQNQNNTCYDAFVCYSGKNRKWVSRRLVPILERRPQNYTLCLFDRDFRLGTHIVSNIVDAIDQSSKVIVVLTQHFVDSKWCQWELEMAQHKLLSEDRHCLVLLVLEDLEPERLPRLLRFLLDTRPVVRWPRNETAPTVLAAAAELRRALGPSLSQRLRQGPEPRPSVSADDERTPLLAHQDT